MGIGEVFLGAAAGSATVAIIVKAYDQFSDTFRKAEVGATKLGTAMKVGGIGVVAVGTALITFGKSAVKAAMAAEPIIANFKRMTTGSDALIQSLVNVTKETVDDTDLMQLSVKALARGIEQARLPELFEKAAIAGQIMGVETSDAIDTLTTGLATQQPRLLKQLGIIMDSTEANQKWADSHNTVVKSMTEAQKAMAFEEEAMRKLNGVIGDSELNLTYQKQLDQIKVAYKNMQEEIGNRLIPHLEKLTSIVLKNKEGFLKLGDVVGDILEGGLKILVQYVDKMEKLGEILYKINHWRPFAETTTPTGTELGTPEDIARQEQNYRDKEAAMKAYRGGTLPGTTGIGADIERPLQQHSEAVISDTETTRIAEQEKINLMDNEYLMGETVKSMTTLYKDGIITKDMDMQAVMEATDAQVEYTKCLETLDEKTRKVVQTMVEAASALNKTQGNKRAGKGGGTAEGTSDLTALGEGKSNVVWDTASQSYMSKNEYSASNGYNPALHSGIVNNYFTKDSSSNTRRIAGVT